MLTSVKIERFRGIHEGALESLGPLVVLVGPNSTGKSSILDAVLIAAHRSVAGAVGRVVQRRPGLWNGARWLLWRGAEEKEAAKVEITLSDGKPRLCTLRWTEEVDEPNRRRLAEKGAPGPYSTIEARVPSSGSESYTAFAADNTYAEMGDDSESFPGSSDVWLVDARSATLGLPLHELYSRAVQRGRRQPAIDLVSQIVRGLRNIEILTEHGTPVLYLVFDDYSVPVSLGGDGVQALLRISFELTSRSSGIVLMEEPEVHQHPAAIRQSARAIIEGMRRGNQIILTTHSLELIDGLLSELNVGELDALSVYRLKLDAGRLHHTRIAGQDVAFARNEIGDDLR